jgi:hypothetical protein
METLKCNGHDLNTYVDRFLYLVSKAKLTGDKEKVRMFAKGFAESSPYQDKLKRLMEEEKSLDEITAELHRYYATVVCLSAPAMKETTQQVEEGTQKGRNSKKRRKGNDDDAAKTQEKKNDNGQKVVSPRPTKEDYGKLSKDEKIQLAKTGKVSGYTISQNPGPDGTHTIKKTPEKPAARRNVVQPEAEVDYDDDSDHKSIDGPIMESLKEMGGFW